MADPVTPSVTDPFAALTPGRVYDSGPSLDPAQREQIASCGVAALAGCLPPPLAQAQLISSDELPRRTGRGPVAGVAVTVWNPPGSTQMNAVGMQMLRPGDFMVLRGDGQTPMWGDNMATRALAQGAVGALLDGVARDVAEVDALDFSVWARRVYVGDNSRRMRPGLVNIPIRVGGVGVVPGDVVVADDDGVLVIPRHLVDLAASAAAAKAEEDLRIRTAAAEGRMSADLQAIYRVPVEEPEVVRVGAPWR